MKYTATFSNGKTISRNSKRNYTHAYMVWCANLDGTTYVAKYGFSGNEELAKKASILASIYVVKSEVVEVIKY